MEKRVRSNWTMSDPDQDAWNDLADELEKANARIQWLEDSVDDHMEIAEKYSTLTKKLKEALLAEADEWECVVFAFPRGDSRQDVVRDRAKKLRALAGEGAEGE